jgi:hypothetical protein
MIKIIEETKLREIPQMEPGLSPQRLAEIKIKIARQHYFSKKVLLKVAEKLMEDL